MVNLADNPTIEEEYLALASLIMMAEHVDFDKPFKRSNNATKKTFNRISRNQKIYTFFGVYWNEIQTHKNNINISNFHYLVPDEGNGTSLQDEPVKFEDLKNLELGHHKSLSFWNLNTDQRKVS